MAEFIFNGTDLEKKFFEVKKRLFNRSRSNFFEIEYKNNDTELNFPENNKRFLDAIGNAPAVYCIWLKRGQKEFGPVYVGHAKKPRDRMKNYLSKKHEKTGAVLAKVQDAVKKKGKIGVTFVKIQPPYMRTAVEEWLISKIGKSVLIWNKRGGD